jgi:hypothetical protein
MTLINLNDRHDDEAALARLGGAINDLCLIGAGPENVARLAQAHEELGRLLQRLTEED